MKNRNYTTEHNRRQQLKKRLAWEVDRDKWERMTPKAQQELKNAVQTVITEHMKGEDK